MADGSVKIDVDLDEAKAEKELNELKKDLSSVDGDAFDDLKKSADKAADSIEDVGDSAKSTSDDMSGMNIATQILASEGIQKLCSAVTDAVKSFVGLGESTQEYREDMGKLKTAFETAGLSTESATETYRDFYAVLGESDRSVEAVNHLAKLVSSEQDLDTWTTICTGVWGTFGDSLPIEGLTEAANETSKTGQVVGVLADALNWAGVSEDDFNNSLALCNSEGERAQLIQDTLNGLYSEAAENYEENNKSIMENRDSQVRLNDAMSEFGGEIEETLNPVLDILAGALEKISKWFSDLPEPVQQCIVIVGIIAGVMAALIPILVMLATAEWAAIAPLLPVIGIIAAIVAAIAVIIVIISNWGSICEWFRNLWDSIVAAVSNAWNSLMTKIQSVVDAIKQKFNSFIDGVVGLYNSVKEKITGVVNVFKELPVKIWEAIGNLKNKLFDWGKDMIQGFIDGIKNMINKVGEAASNIAEKIKEFLHFSKPDTGPLREYEKWMPDMMKGIAEGINSNIGLVEKSMKKASEAISTPLKSSFYLDSQSEVKSVFSNSFDKIIDKLNEVNTGIMLNDNGTSESNVTLNVNLGGAKVAEQIFKLNKKGQLILQG